MESLYLFTYCNTVPTLRITVGYMCLMFRIHVISDCSSSDIVSQLRHQFRDTVVADFSDVSDAALKIYHLAK